MTINVTKAEFDDKMEHIDARLKNLQDEQADQRGDIKFLVRTVEAIENRLQASPPQSIQLVLPPGFTPAPAAEAGLAAIKTKLVNAMLVAIMIVVLVGFVIMGAHLLSPEALKVGKTAVEAISK